MGIFQSKNDIFCQLARNLKDSELKDFWKNLYKLPNINYKLTNDYENNDYFYHKDSTIISYAIDYNTIQTLIELYDVNINNQDVQGDNMIHQHIINGIYNLQIFQLLIDNGLDINMKNYSNEDALILLLENTDYLRYNEDSFFTIFLWFLQNGLIVTKELIFKTYLSTNLTLIKMVLQYYDGDINIIDKWGNNLMIHAILCENSPVDLYDILLDRNINIKFQNRLGNNVLHYALYRSNTQTIINLINYGADLFVKNHIGTLPFDKYIDNDNFDIRVLNKINSKWIKLLDQLLDGHMIEDNKFLIYDYVRY